MIARADGQVVLVAGTLPGERVRARVERVGKGVAYATAETIEERSPDRRDTPADPACGGCLFAHVSYARQLSLKAEIIADAFGRIGHMPWSAPIRVAASPEQGYRMRARLHVRGRAVGFFREGTHEVCSARGTGQLLPATADVLDRVAASLVSADLGGAREIELSENVEASERALALGASAPIDARVLQAIGDTDGVSSLSVLNITTAGGRTITGAPYVTDTLDLAGTSVKLRRHVLAFFQGNRHLLRDFVAHVVAQVPEQSAIIDLYAGAGLFAVSAAAARGARVTAVEGDRLGAADLDANAKASGGAITSVHQGVEAFAAGFRSPVDMAIVDPPRTGMSREALEGVIRIRAPRLVYVSCDVATLARDARRLVDAGYELNALDAFDLFPNTPHVETVAGLSLR